MWFWNSKLYTSICGPDLPPEWLDVIPDLEVEARRQSHPCRPLQDVEIAVGHHPIGPNQGQGFQYVS